MLVDIDSQGEICVLRLSGRFLTGVDPDYLKNKADEIKGRKSVKMLVDLHDVSSMGSTGIGFLVGIYTSVTRNPGGRFVLVAPSPRVREVLELTRLITVLGVAKDMTAGLAVLRGEPDTARGAQSG